jgi:hypothetical protein
VEHRSEERGFLDFTTMAFHGWGSVCGLLGIVFLCVFLAFER